MIIKLREINSSSFRSRPTPRTFFISFSTGRSTKSDKNVHLRKHLIKSERMKFSFIISFRYCPCCLFFVLHIFRRLHHLINGTRNAVIFDLVFIRFWLDFFAFVWSVFVWTVPYVFSLVDYRVQSFCRPHQKFTVQHLC